jgi:hypothetical protein
VASIVHTSDSAQDSPEQQPALLKQCTQGVLRHCNRLTILGGIDEQASDRIQVALQILTQSWRPDPSLVDGSSPLLAADGPEGNPVRLGTVMGAGWHLALDFFVRTPPVLSPLPQGLTRLELRCVWPVQTSAASAPVVVLGALQLPCARMLLTSVYLLDLLDFYL